MFADSLVNVLDNNVLVVLELTEVGLQLLTVVLLDGPEGGDLYLARQKHS